MSQPVQRKMRRTNTYIGWNIGVDVLHVKGGKGERRRSGRRMRRRRRKIRLLLFLRPKLVKHLRDILTFSTFGAGAAG